MAFKSALNLEEATPYKPRGSDAQRFALQSDVYWKVTTILNVLQTKDSRFGNYCNRKLVKDSDSPALGWSLSPTLPKDFFPFKMVGSQSFGAIILP